jgi:predicted phosphodiesterase
VDDDPADIVVCGGSHVAFQRDIDDVVRILGVGSVGAAPEGRIAHYAVLTPRMDGTLVEQTWVEY